MIGRVLDALSDDVLHWQLLASRPVATPDARHGLPGTCYCRECVKQMYFWWYEGQAIRNGRPAAQTR
eukprot:14139640-Alexandrium_andersonii.AAC.1